MVKINDDEIEMIRKWYKAHPDGSTVDCSKEIGLPVYSIYFNKEKIPEFRLPVARNITIFNQEMKDGLMYGELSEVFLNSDRIKVHKGIGVNDKNIRFIGDFSIEGLKIDAENSYIYFADNMISHISLAAVAVNSNSRRSKHEKWLEKMFGEPNMGKAFSNYDFENCRIYNDMTLDHDYRITIAYKKQRGRFIVNGE